MLKPTKFTNPEKTVLATATTLLERLREKRIESYSDLLAYTRSQLQDVDILFVPSLSFLFLLNLIEYRPKVDAFEYVGK